jgi:hypothetical protein
MTPGIRERKSSQTARMASGRASASGILWRRRVARIRVWKASQEVTFHDEKAHIYVPIRRIIIREFKAQVTRRYQNCNLISML